MYLHLHSSQIFLHHSPHSPNNQQSCSNTKRSQFHDRKIFSSMAMMPVAGQHCQIWITSPIAGSNVWMILEEHQLITRRRRRRRIDLENALLRLAGTDTSWGFAGVDGGSNCCCCCYLLRAKSARADGSAKFGLEGYKAHILHDAQRYPSLSRPTNTMQNRDVLYVLYMYILFKLYHNY